MIKARFLVKKEPQTMSVEIQQRAMVAQKRTSAHKALVYISRNNPSVIYKGPYSLKKKEEMIAQTLFRRELFQNVWKNGCNVCGPIEVVQFEGDEENVFLKMPHICHENQLFDQKTDWKTTLTNVLGEEDEKAVVSKESQGIVELSFYLLQPKNLTQEEVVVRSLIHFIHRYICDPVVGDAALRNVLIAIHADVHMAFGIDFEENRTGDDNKRELEKKGGFFDMLSGGKRWNSTALDVLRDVLKKNNERIINYIEKDIETCWPEVERLILSHKMTNVSVEKMRVRCSDILNAISTNFTNGKRKRQE